MIVMTTTKTCWSVVCLYKNHMYTHTHQYMPTPAFWISTVPDGFRSAAHLCSASTVVMGTGRERVCARYNRQ